jgi:nicotinate-nucleotide adenylyltransferase
VTPGQRIGIFGGTFDPIHLGHIVVAKLVGQHLKLDYVALMPSRQPVHRAARPAACSYHRFAMVALAVMPHDQLVASPLELERSGPTFTSTTLDHLLSVGHRPQQIFFITGADTFAEIGTWHDYPAVLDKAVFVVITRPGFSIDHLAKVRPDLGSRMIRDVSSASATTSTGHTTPILLLDLVTPEVSSTEVRRRIASGEAFEDLVPSPVHDYIRRHELYGWQREPTSAGLEARHLHE